MISMLVFVVASALPAQDAPLIRIDSGVSGHIHPALCVTKKGTLVAVYCKSEYKPYLITRSTDAGGEKINFIVSRDDGKIWDLDHPVEFYNPGRPIGGRACPKTVAIDDKTLGTIFFDTDAKQAGGSGVFFRATPIAALAEHLKRDGQD